MTRAVAGFVLFLAALPAPPQSMVDLQAGFDQPPDDARIMMRWWWFGPAVTKREIEREIRAMKEGGIGGFEVAFDYPLSLDDPQIGLRNVPYLSDEFLDALRFASQKARENGLRMDLTLGSGWPYGGPNVNVTDAAGRLRIDRIKVEAASRRVPLPSLSAGEKLMAAFTTNPVHEVTEFRDGAAWLPGDLRGPADVQFFISSRTGQMVKRAAVGAEGFVVDHYDRTATDRYLKTTGDRFLQAFGQQPPYSIFCDSLEVYGSDWTPGFLEEFQKRRGYDLKPHLPALAGGVTPESAEVRYDWSRTLSELVDENFLTPIREWSHRNGTKFRAQSYGTPPATLASYRYVDLPEGEGAQWKMLRPTRWASSASHLLGHNVTSSETWTWLHSPSFRATPLDMKAEADRHFLQGVNQLIGHGWPYTAEGVEYPGWRLYAAAVFDEKNPWWIVMPDIAQYLQRMSWMMRQGEPANDVALYLPTADAFAHLAPGDVEMMNALQSRTGNDVIARILEAGYNLDFVDDGLLEKLGTRYRILVMPNVERIAPAALRRIEAFAKRGGTVVATRRLPERAPGLLATAADQKEVQAITQRLFLGVGGVLVADENRDLAKVLHAKVPPDVAAAPNTPEFGFLHRRTASEDIYFVANTGNTARTLKLTFRVTGRNAEVWNALTGEVNATESEGGTVDLTLEPYGSRVVIFTERVLPRPAMRAPRTVPPPVDLSRGWTVAFGGSAARVSMDSLQSWTDAEATRFFSGVAIYRKEFDLPAPMLQPGVRLYVDFGETKPIPEGTVTNGMQAWLDAPLRDAAVIFVNGERAGSVWCPPYALDVTRLLKPGRNELRIDVANTAMNYMAGGKLPDYRLLNLRYGERFQPQDMKLVRPEPSGILGSVKLAAERR